MTFIPFQSFGVFAIRTLELGRKDSTSTLITLFYILNSIGYILNKFFLIIVF